jgi:hypothetical protein
MGGNAAEIGAALRIACREGFRERVAKRRRPVAVEGQQAAKNVVSMR